jgi:hypothetical protein
VNHQVGLLFDEVNAKHPSHAGDSAAEVTLAMARCGCRVMLAMVLSRQLGRDLILVLSHASDGATEATWPRRDVGAESCWR